MDYDLIDIYNSKSTKELVQILEDNDTGLYKKETFDIIKNILKGRGVVIEENNYNTTKRTTNKPEISNKTILILLCLILIVFAFLSFNDQKSSDRSTIKSYTSTSLKSFTHARVGEKWVMQDNNVSVMKSPIAPGNKQQYMGNLNTIIGVGDVVKIIGTKGLYWKHVQLYNNGVVYATGWILSDTVDKAQITQQ